MTNSHTDSYTSLCYRNLPWLVFYVPNLRRQMTHKCFPVLLGKTLFVVYVSDYVSEWHIRAMLRFFANAFPAKQWFTRLFFSSYCFRNFKVWCCKKFHQGKVEMFVCRKKNNISKTPFPICFASGRCKQFFSGTFKIFLEHELQMYLGL